MSEKIRADALSPPNADARRDILVQAGLFAQDPSSYPGLADTMDPASGIDTAFQPIAYDTRNTTSAMVPCSICPQKQPHYDGAIVRLKDSKVGLVGNECGKRHFFGDDGWQVLQSRMRADADQAVFLARFGPAKEAITAIEPLLLSWSHSHRRVNNFRRRFRSSAGKLFEAILRHGRGGSLSVEEEVLVPFKARDGSIEHRKEIHTRVVCRIGARWFFEGEALSEEIDQVRERALTALGFLRADATPANVNAVQRMLRICRRTLDDVATKQRDLMPLLNEQTVGHLADWANAASKSKGTYEARGKVITWAVPGRESVTVDFGAIPSDLADNWEKVSRNWPSL